MQSDVCCGCRKVLTYSDNRKNIFCDDLSISNRGHELHLKVHSAVELLTGNKISKADGLPTNVCAGCFDQLGLFMNFRMQFINSLSVLLNTDVDESGPNDKLPNDSGIELNHCKSSTGEFKSPETKSNDSISINENNTLPDVSNIQNESDTNDSLISIKGSNIQDNGKLNDSESSVESVGDCRLNETRFKYQQNDLESDIDVCSGDEDEVLELDIQIRHNEMVEIESSSESDIEVCDYEPNGKRLRNYNALSPPIPF